MSRLIVDVREPFEYKSGHVTGAVNMPLSRLERDVERLLEDMDADTELILYCRSGSRASVAMSMLRNLGYSNVTNGINQDHVTARYL